MECHKNCGVCCILFSSDWKKAYEPCEHLTEDRRCAIYDERPEVCRNLKARKIMCGDNPTEAEQIISKEWL
jgi:Fe-S-cluster containining protein